jgi:hypothetical protein
MSSPKHSPKRQHALKLSAFQKMEFAHLLPVPMEQEKEAIHQARRALNDVFRRIDLSTATLTLDAVRAAVGHNLVETFYLVLPKSSTQQWIRQAAHDWYQKPVRMGKGVADELQWFVETFLYHLISTATRKRTGLEWHVRSAMKAMKN